MAEYVTTNIRLPKAIYEQAKKLAHEENKSLAQLIRESLVDYLVESREQPSRVKDDDFDDPIYHVAELTRPDEVNWNDRPTDTSVRHDFYLYGADLDDIPEQIKP
ncbi:MAG: CopG family transcriptional regulator [Anaerolineae bacterium]